MNFQLVQVGDFSAIFLKDRFFFVPEKSRSEIPVFATRMNGHGSRVLNQNFSKLPGNNSNFCFKDYVSEPSEFPTFLNRFLSHDLNRWNRTLEQDRIVSVNRFFRKSPQHQSSSKSEEFVLSLTTVKFCERYEHRFSRKQRSNRSPLRIRSNYSCREDWRLK